MPLIALALPVLGAILGEMSGSRPGWPFVVAGVLGGALAAATCSRAGAWWVAYAPPPVAMFITVAVESAAGRTGSHVATGAVRWAVDAFPAMAWTEAAVVAVLASRWFRARRSTPGKGMERGARHDA
ncbi:DUF6542 domain-containing protein [Streptomyces sp. UNOC14_S4]|uniref:DUF6542 domain-containing protein n=1 Tax=Streptomyces sp. UNOC14_S4 TaxID=2872340 RepID=UPI001E3CB972|nr:DUF6542 domain-containing protein [Streptomyces sp. UNOC14_S4]MCC3770758.1 hypothetical protein [Streptomyces sp. UNOC14_S4]